MKEGQGTPEAAIDLCAGDETIEQNVSRQLLTYWPPILIVIGTMGNILTALILWKMAPKILSTCLYVFVILIVDLVSLYIRSGNDWFTNMADIDIKYKAQHSSNSVCKIYPFVTDWTFHFSVWLVVAMAVETTIVTLQPQKLMRVCRVERVRAVILLLIVLIVCLDAHNFWTFSLTAEEKAGVKIYSCTNVRQGNQLSTVFRKTAWPILDILLGDLLPMCVTLSCTTIMVTRRLRLPDQVRLLETTWKTYSVDSITARHLQTCIIIVVGGHFILMIPKLGFDIFSLLIDPALDLVVESCALHSKHILFESISSIILYTFFSCKVFIFMGVSPLFRQRMFALLTCSSCYNEAPSPQPPVSTQQPLLNTLTDPYPTNYHKDNGVQQTRILYTSTSV